VKPLLVNRYSKDECRVWGRTIFDGWDMEPEEIPVDLELGEIPEWFDYEWREMKFDMLEAPFKSNDLWTSEASVWHLPTWFSWIFKHGLAPGQPFQISILFPDYITSETMEGTEYDVHYYAELCDVVPWTAKQAAYAWERYPKLAKRQWVETGKQVLRDDERRRAATDHMFVDFTHYHGDGYYDEMAGPTHVRATLVSRLKLGGNPHYIPYHPIAHGEGFRFESNWVETAIEKLYSAVQKANIPLSLEQLKKLPRR